MEEVADALRIVGGNAQLFANAFVNVFSKRLGSFDAQSVKIEITGVFAALEELMSFMRSAITDGDERKTDHVHLAGGARGKEVRDAKAPAFFFNVGGMPKGKNPKDTAAHHTPDFYIDDSRLDVGIKAFCNIVFDYTK